MRLFIVLLVVVVGAALIVGATVFRSERAVTMLRLLRRVGWAYVIAVLVMAAYYLWQGT